MKYKDNICEENLSLIERNSLKNLLYLMLETECNQIYEKE